MSKVKTTILGVGMLRGEPGIRSFEVPMPEIKQPDDVLVRMKEVGLDGTDFNMVRYNLQDVAEGKNQITYPAEGMRARNLPRFNPVWRTYGRFAERSEGREENRQTVPGRDEIHT